MEGAFLAVLAALVAGATATLLWPAIGYHLFGAALLALVGWLVRYDVARRTVRGRGLPRYVANVVALVGFVACAATLAVRGRHRPAVTR